jgi:hypothetical protein
MISSKEIKVEIEEVEGKILNNKNIIRIMTNEGNETEVEKAKRHLAKNEGKLIGLKNQLKSKRRKHRVTLQDKVDSLKEEHYNLMEEYGDKYGSNDGSFECEQMLHRLRELETTFKCLGV